LGIRYLFSVVFPFDLYAIALAIIKIHTAQRGEQAKIVGL
jgi:hypothetical protein